MAYREGERELREAVARALGEGRVKEDYGRWFWYDDNRTLIGSPELVERFLNELAELMFLSMKKGGRVVCSGFGTFYVGKTASRVGSGALAGRLLPARTSVAFVPAVGGWGAGVFAPQDQEPPII